MWNYIDKYSSTLSTEKSEALKWLTRETNLRTNHARMLSGDYQGRFLAMISSIISPRRILELGAFTGYSTICLSQGLSQGGVIDTVEVNDELEDLITEAYEMAGIKDAVNLHLGDAKEIIPTLEYEYDLVYIDANKREYPLYFELSLPKVRKSGVIIADNVLWDGKVFSEYIYKDAQTQGILRFNEIVASDPRVDNIIIPIRDGMNLIRVK